MKNFFLRAEQQIPSHFGYNYIHSKFYVFILCITIVLQSSFVTLSQIDALEFNHITSLDGLASNSVFCILQDNKGFLWFGTFDGLCRYDGYRFEIFKNIPEDDESISDNKIRVMCEDDNGNIWIGTWQNGINKYDPRTDKFTRFLHDESNPHSISSNSILSICLDDSNYLWVGTADERLNKFDIDKNIFIVYSHTSPKTDNHDNTIYSIYEDKEGELWLGTGNNTLKHFDKSIEKFTSYKLNPEYGPATSVGRITSIVEDNSDNLWISSNATGIFKFNKRGRKISEHLSADNQTLCTNSIWDIYLDNKGVFWIGTDNNGLIKYDPVKQQINCFQKDLGDPGGLNDNTIYKIFEDKTGIFWIGTWNGGINKHNKFEKKFTTYTHNKDDPYSLSTNSIYAIYEDSYGDLWIGTDVFGLNRKISGDTRFLHYFNKPGNPGSMSSNTIYSICEDNENNLWIATSNGLNKYDRSKNKFIRFLHNPSDSSTICNNIISQIFSDSKGDLWICLANGCIDKIESETTIVKHFRHDHQNPKSITQALIFDFIEDNSGNFWIGTFGDGLFEFDKKEQQFINYKYDPKNHTSISHNEISVIHIDKIGYLWIGTNGGGLNRFDAEKKTFTRYRTQDGLPSDMICGILEDNSGNLWISTYKGLSKFNLRTKLFRNYSVEEGLQGIEFNNWAYFKGREGRMYFGGTNGFNVFHPDSIIDNTFIPPIVITNFQLLHKPVSTGFDPLWNRTILEKSITETEEIELNHDDNIISFEFAALDYRNPIKNRYKYLLENFEEEWTSTDGRLRYVTYTNLNPGEYIFRVKGSNNDGIWNEAGASIKLIINPPWWATWWAYSIYGLMIILIVLTLREYDLRRQRLKHELELEHKHAEKLEEIDKMKSMFFANISHEFRTPLTLIVGPAKKLITTSKEEESVKQAGIINKNASRLLGLINQLLDLSKLEAGKLMLQAAPTNIVAFVKGIAMTFESIAESKDITFKIKPEKVEIEVYFDRDKMQKILMNILSNSFKFTTEGGKITIRIAEKEDQRAIITVRDTGVGISKNDLPKLFDRFYQADSSHTREHEGTGIGLALTKELVELHGGEIRIDSLEGEWTEVVVEIPMGKGHLKKDEIYEFSEPESEPMEIFDEDYSAGAEERSFVAEETEGEKNIVLVVEDNADVREYIRESIDRGDYQVLEAVNGEQGLRKAEKMIPDLIVSDIMMPKMDGIALLRRIKNDTKTSHIPVILLTAKSEQSDKLEGLTEGADAYLTKPFDIEELQVRIRSLIEQRRKLQKKFSSGDYVPEREGKKLSKLDEEFMKKLMGIIDEHISEEEFSIDQFGREAGMSRSQIHRKLKGLTGKSPSQYLRLVRLSRAKEMIEEEKGTVSEIAYTVGFSSPAYFSRCFKTEFGYSPSEIGK